ncbi:MAG: zinc ABC transporter ATP-binding protein ZnuC [Pseudomonadota bacterium]|uniref:zinc ABC transporter ATP-binding protein ZnuC n=1 Tax=Fodinicurvata fenggangensis TaxID=1121830 RepID=UPI00068E6110|nr:zinc ABC transporter ATP-binding protein ZnuC [Fodinicurvata fenggangensis]
MTNSSATLIETSGVGLTLGSRQILESIDLVIAPGEIVTVIGPNGAGKTSLLRIILGLQKPGRGKVRRRSGLRMGYVPQSMSVGPTLPLSVLHFLSLPDRQPRQKRLEALNELGIGHLAEAQLYSLSGGEFQRVLLARTLLRDPDLLVLDEPAQAIDFIGQTELYRLIDRVRRERGCGVLLVSHDLHLVMAATDRVICLNRHICCSGEPETVSQHPEYLSMFGPRAAQALAVYHHHHDHHHDLDGTPVEEADSTARQTEQQKENSHAG